MREEQIIRGIPLWLLREYLEEIGGQTDANGRVIGEGWVANLSLAEPFQIGSLRIGQVKLEIEGEAAAINRMQPLLAQKTMRAGA